MPRAKSAPGDLPSDRVLLEYLNEEGVVTLAELREAGILELKHLDKTITRLQRLGLVKRWQAVPPGVRRTAEHVWVCLWGDGIGEAEPLHTHRWHSAGYLGRRCDDCGLEIRITHPGR